MTAADGGPAVDNTHLLPIVFALVVMLLSSGVLTVGIGYHMDAMPG